MTRSTTILLVRVLLVGLLAGVFALDRRAGQPGPGAGQPVPFRLVEVAADSGVRFEHRACRVDERLANIEPHLAGLGAAVAVCDANGDGHPDLFATSSAFDSSCALYVNDGSGHFSERAAEAGLAELSRAGEGAAMGSIWADADGDGDQDAFVYRYGYTLLFENLGGLRFREVGQAAGLRRWMNCNAATWIDYDRDGRLDLYVAGYFHERVDLWNADDTRFMQSSFEFADNGGHNLLFRNLGGLRFEDVSERTGVDSTRWTMAVVAADLDRDGWCDLYLANDYGPEEFLRNLGGERFERREDVGLAESSKSGMCVTVGDFDNSGALSLFVTNISRRGFLFQGNNLRLNRLGASGRARFHNLSDTSSSTSREVTDCGWAWGAQFGDLDNDGLADLFVANGFISASRDQEYWYDMAKVAGGAGDLFTDARNWPTIGGKSLSGYERSRVLWNLGRQRFQEVGEIVGVEDRHDGRAVALADLAGRGALDVIVANQKGPLLIYRSEPPPDAGWVQVQLVGSDGNRDAIGASLELQLDDGTRQVQAVLAGSGFSAQNELALHFGLGAKRSVAGARIHWPSGRVQELGALEAGRRHRIEEPAP